MSFRDFIYLCYGQSVEEYKRRLEAGLVLREAIRRRVPLDEGTLRVQFALARDYYSDPVWYEVSHILITPTGGMDKADEHARLDAITLADRVYQLCVARPEDFTKLVLEHSMDSAENKARNGSLGYCYPYVRSPDFVEAPALYREIKKQNLQRGQFSTPVRSFRGWHIVRVDMAHPAMRAEFDQAKDRVERDYLQERAKMYTDLWLRSLTNQAKVKRYLFKPAGAPIEVLPPDNFPLPRDK
jgi:parvulin-like peptidyl-prolyl isomerase